MNTDKHRSVLLGLKFFAA